MSLTPPKENWFNRPMRWAQLTLTKPIPSTIMSNSYIGFAAQRRCLPERWGLRLLLSTQIPLHYRTPSIGDRDPFGELYEGCRQFGHECHRPHQSPRRTPGCFYDAHPDWVMVGSDGQPMRH